MHQFNINSNTAYFDIETRTGQCYDENEILLFTFQIDAGRNNEVRLWIGKESWQFTEVRNILNKTIRAELVYAFEQVQAEEDETRESFYQPDPDFIHDNRSHY